MADSIETTIPGTVASASIASSAGDGPSAVEVEVLELFDRLRERLLGYLLRFNALSTADAEDVVQEAFLALYQHLQRGRSRENLPGWLFRVVHNLGLKRAQGSRRDTQRTVLLAEASEDVVVDHAPNPEAASAESFESGCSGRGAPRGARFRMRASALRRAPLLASTDGSTGMKHSDCTAHHAVAVVTIVSTAWRMRSLSVLMTTS